MSQRGTKLRTRSQQPLSQNETHIPESQSQARTSRKKRHPQSGKENFSQKTLSQNVLSQSLSDEEYNGDLTHTDISKEEFNNLVSTTIRYLLVMDRQKTPIVRINIQKHALNNSKKYRVIMPEVKKVLKKTFGFNLVEFEPGKFILVNAIPNTLPHLTFSPTERSRQVLLFLLLGHIFMSDNSCTEESLWQFLRNLGILIGEEKHAYFGDVRALVSGDFIKQRYIEKVKVNNNGVETVNYTWGVRAEYEFHPRSVLEFVEQVYQNRKMDTWKDQYNAMLQRERVDNRDE